MKLYATVTSERDSRPAKKGGDEYIAITLSNGNIACFDIKFIPDDLLGKRGKLEIMSYRNGPEGTITIDY